MYETQRSLNTLNEIDDLINTYSHDPKIRDILVQTHQLRQTKGARRCPYDAQNSKRAIGDRLNYNVISQRAYRQALILISPLEVVYLHGYHFLPLSFALQRQYSLCYRCTPRLQRHYINTRAIL